MRFVDGRVVFAASDLNDYLVCAHRVALRHDAIERNVPIPDDDPTLAIVARKGRQHERAVLDQFVAGGREVTEVPADDGSPTLLKAAVEATVRAMRRGDAVIYQAAFLHEGWTGRADFLERVETPSSLGSWSYVVADTKLALRAQPAFLVQLCLYAEFVEAIQGRLPDAVRAIFGDRSFVPYDPRRYLPYVRSAKQRFAQRQGLLRADDIPDRIGACGRCPWAGRCDDARRKADHLSLVAWIRRDQMAKLREGGIATLTALAHAREADAPRGMASFPTLQRQARLQLAQRTTGTLAYELLERREHAGFELLPPPDPHDVYFDMEGDPLYEAGAGLEYLFGAYVGGTMRTYTPWWGETREQERAAFQKFIDWLVAHRRAHPGAHVYHYAPYERTKLRELAMRHVTREEEVDDLLRDGALVDLFAVVRGALAQSQESYSIKKLEPFYGFARSTDVRKGDQSIVAFEEYLLDRNEERRSDIIDYNREDCESTAQLHAWLLSLRPGEGSWRDACGAEAQAERVDDTERRALEEALGAMPGDAEKLAAHLLAYHKREAKPQQWAVFDRCESDIDFVHDDHEALGGLELSDDPEHAPTRSRTSAGPTEYTYRFPTQQHKLGRDPVDPALRKVRKVVWIDGDAGLIRVKVPSGAPHPKALIPGWPISTDGHAAALMRFGVAVRDGTAARDFPAAWAMLKREAPRIIGVPAGATIQPALREGEEAVDPLDVADLALRLDRSTLVVQGPPGSGKTFVGAHVIAALIAAGKRVGVTSTSHKAINNLLYAVERVAGSQSLTFRGVKKCERDNPETQFVSEYGLIVNEHENAPFDAFELVAGTSWLFVNKNPKTALAPVDVLVVDEAGQFALADAIAVATKADSIVLLGDPLQLAHVSQGTHPEGAAASVLTHIVGEGRTVAPDRGVFLDRSFRMHPALTAFVSTMVYGGRLESAASCARQRIDSRWFSGAALRYVPVTHTGNAQSSEEEAKAVVEIVGELLGGAFTDRHWRTHRLGLHDIVVVAPYNAQVDLIARRMRARFGEGARVGTVDRFQGQEAPAVIYSLAASSAEDAPRGAGFLFEQNRFNVAVSRGRALAVLVCSPALLETACPTVDLLRSVAAFCGFAEAAAV